MISQCTLRVAFTLLVLGTKTAPFMSLLSKSLYGLLVHPADATVVYASPPLADALNWPWVSCLFEKPNMQDPPIVQEDALAAI